VTGSDGKYQINGLPLGIYTIAFVQEKLGDFIGVNLDMLPDHGVRSLASIAPTME